MAAKYKLMYFDGKGRAENSRMLFELAGVEYEDKRFKHEEWPAIKPTTPFGQAPALEVDGVMLAQSHTIERFLARRFGLIGKSEIEQAQVEMIVDYIEDMLKPLGDVHQEKDEAKKADLLKEYTSKTLPTSLGYLKQILKNNKNLYFIGGDITLADIALSNGLDWLKMMEVDYDVKESDPEIQALKAKVESNEKIAAWIAKRPVTKF